MGGWIKEAKGKRQRANG